MEPHVNRRDSRKNFQVHIRQLLVKQAPGHPRCDKLMRFVGFNEVDWRLYETAGFSYRPAECVHLCSSSLRQIITYLKKLSAITVYRNCSQSNKNRASFNIMCIFLCTKKMQEKMQMYRKDRICIYLRYIIIDQHRSDNNYSIVHLGFQNQLSISRYVKIVNNMEIIFTCRDSPTKINLIVID